MEWPQNAAFDTGVHEEERSEGGRTDGGVWYTYGGVRVHGGIGSTSVMGER